MGGKIFRQKSHNVSLSSRNHIGLYSVHYSHVPWSVFACDSSIWRNIFLWGLTTGCMSADCERFFKVWLCKTIGFHEKERRGEDQFVNMVTIFPSARHPPTPPRPLLICRSILTISPLLLLRLIPRLFCACRVSHALPPHPTPPQTDTHCDRNTYMCTLVLTNMRARWCPHAELQQTT